MMTTARTLMSMTAASLMSRDLLLLPDEMPLRDAARELLRRGVSGAPVVDARGRVIGVISATDFVRRFGFGERPNPESLPCHGEFFADWQLDDVEDLPLDAVRGYMSRKPITTERKTPIQELARRMVECHIHRLVVVDEDQFPVGIVTSGDILTAIAKWEYEE